MGGVIFHTASRDSSHSSVSLNVIDEKNLNVKNHQRYHPFENNGPYTVLYKIGE